MATTQSQELAATNEAQFLAESVWRGAGGAKGVGVFGGYSDLL